MEWFTDEQMDALAVRVTLHDVTRSHECEARMGVVGKANGRYMVALETMGWGDTPRFWNRLFFEGPELRGDGTSLAQVLRETWPLHGEDAGRFLSVVEYSAGAIQNALEFAPEAPDLRLAFVGRGLEPWPTHTTAPWLGANSAGIQISCAKPTKLSLEVSHEAVLLHPSDFPNGTHATVMVAGVSSASHSGTFFSSDEVTVLAGPPGHRHDGLQRGTFRVTSPDGPSEWNLTTPDLFWVSGTRGEYDFELDRVGVAHAGPFCTRFCDNDFWAAAYGLSPVDLPFK